MIETVKVVQDLTPTAHILYGFAIGIGTLLPALYPAINWLHKRWETQRQKKEDRDPHYLRQAEFEAYKDEQEQKTQGFKNDVLNKLEQSRIEMNGFGNLMKQAAEMAIEASKSIHQTANDVVARLEKSSIEQRETLEVFRIGIKTSLRAAHDAAHDSEVIANDAKGMVNLHEGRIAGAEKRINSLEQRAS